MPIVTFELDVAQWQRAARTIDAVIGGLSEPAPLPLPHDRYTRALGDVPAVSDAAAQIAHRDAICELRRLAEQIRSHARASVDTDDRGAQAIGATL